MTNNNDEESVDPALELLDARRITAYKNIRESLERTAYVEKTFLNNLPEDCFPVLLEIAVEGLKLATDEELINHFNFGKIYGYRFDYILELLFHWRIDRIPTEQYKRGMEKYGTAYVPLILLSQRAGLGDLTIESIFAIFGK